MVVTLRTDSMKIRDDFKASLEFTDDFTGDYVYLGDRIDSAGYRYRSFWVANSNLSNTEMHNTYNRFNPSDTTFLWWDGQTTNCLTTFLRDSLYVVGGSLSVDCVGALSPLQDINNSFRVSTDTIINDDTTATMLILIDKDPINDSISNWLESDRARAIAWREYAGSADRNHCHEESRYNERWNHYWDLFIRSNGDTCFDTRTPCENALGTDTGIMQIFRTIWETTFDTTEHWGEYPATFTICSWDSLAWNWRICIDNGRWILNDAMPFKMREEQKEWPDSCSFADCDSVPTIANKEDLSNYGYHAGETRMRALKNQEIWDKKIFHPETLLEIDFADYVKMVRRYKYRGNLW